MTECLNKITRFIKKRDYTYEASDVVNDYRKYYLNNCYCSYTMNICITNNLKELKFIDKYLKKRNRGLKK